MNFQGFRGFFSSKYFGLALLLLCVFAIGKTMAGGRQTVPIAKDREKSKRTAVLKTGGTDERVDVPTGQFVAGNGVIEPKDRETKVSSHVPGRIAHVFVKEGDKVDAGAPLAEMESDAEKANLAAAEGDLGQAKAELLRTTRGLRREDRDAIVADADGARARAELSKSQATRIETLAGGGAATPDELEKAKRQAEADQRALEAANARKQAAVSGSRSEDVMAAQARVSAAEARRDQAKATFERLTIRAPIAGEVLQLKLRAGEYYNPQGGDPIVIIGDTSKLRVRMDVDERDVAKLKVGAPAFATLTAYPGKRFRGHVVDIGHRMGRKNIRTDDPVERIDTKILEVVFELDDRDGLLPGLRVTSYIEY